MKKRKIREMLTAIIDRLDSTAQHGDFAILEARLKAANARAEEAKAKAAEAQQLAEQLKNKSNEALRLKQQLAATEADRDNWKRECERYQQGGNEKRRPE